jgi:ATP-dependent helicase/nuclease subunit A
VSARIIPLEVRRVQTQASDPEACAWVAANAGSGKTHVLAQRVIRLLLNGVDPAKILCITFTKAAAANMATRVFATLAEWTSLDDDALDRAVAEIAGNRPNAAQRAVARRLFACALETPGGLKVQTIHAFCTRLLHQFPFEANVAARFTVLDEAAEAQLLDQLSLAVLLEGAGDPAAPLGKALAKAIVAAADQTFKELVSEAIAARDTLHGWLEHAGSLDAALADLARALGTDPGETREQIDDGLLAEALIGEAEWRGIAAALVHGSKNDQKQAERIATMLAAPESARLEAYLNIFCTGVGDKREGRASLITQRGANAHPLFAERLTAERERILPVLERRRAVACRDRTAALVTVAAAVLERYDAEKKRRGLLDYDDLIDHTLTLFRNTSAGWVLYKLDLGIDHVLVDEAQDTSPKQWEIIERIVGEFAAGFGARGALRRTLFAVGDDKQSIFSFQGAVPQMFAEMRGRFEGAFSAAELAWRNVRFEISFRSGAAVLGAVDDVFAREQAFQGLSADPVKTVHRALPDAAPGLVEIWPLFRAEEAREIEAWDAPFDEVGETSPRVRLARKIAANVRLWQQQGVRAGDVLVLVRQRGPLFESIIRALKDENFPVAGADRLVLTEHIAVMDLMVLADALLLPEDDLALATVLKSPLFGLDEEALFALAHGRSGSLRAALREKSRADPALAAIAARLDALGAAATGARPFAFYADLLGPQGGRRRFLTRLSGEARDALDEFLNLALDYERREPPSLQGFVAWLRGAHAEVKRDMDIGRDEVRVMTVHGAKGLEAPIVILADTTTRPTGPRDPRLLALPCAGAPPGTPDRLVWATARAADVEAVRTARERALRAAQDEYRRLLYVAMTRAAQRLVICGSEGQQRRPENCWYDLVLDALKPHASEEPAEDGDGTVWRYRKGASATVPVPPAPQPAATPAVCPPPWLFTNAPREAAHAAILAPSEAYEEAPPFSADPGAAGAPDATSAAAERRRARARGLLTHRLMQALPDLPPERREAAGRAYLERTANEFSSAERDLILDETLRILAHPRLAPLFGPGSRAEVPIVGRIERPNGPPIPVSGQVDRLMVTPHAVLIADYKTSRDAPKLAADVPKPFVAQLALYRAVLARLYPDRPVVAAVVFTHGPDLLELSPADLDAALAAVTSP